MTNEAKIEEKMPNALTGMALDNVSIEFLKDAFDIVLQDDRLDKNEPAIEASDKKHLQKNKSTI
jgi:hypothetical protein